MNKNEDLHLLIRSLTKSEKKLFKIFSSHDKGEKNYLKLFNAIDAQKIYDEQKLKQKFAGETFIKHLPSEKIYLQKQIMRTLRLFNSETSDEMRVRSLNADAEILYNKWLLPLSEKSARKALALAEETSRLSQLSIALHCLDNIYTYKDVSDKMYKEWSSILNHNRSVRQSMVNISDIRIMSTELIYFSKRYGNHFPEKALNKLRNMLKHPLLSGKTKLLSRHENIERLHLTAYIQYFLGDLQKQADAHLKSIHYYEGLLKQHKQVNLKNVISAISNYIKCRINMKQFVGLNIYFSKYDALKKVAPENTALLLAGISLRDKLKLYCTSGDIPEGLKLIQSTEKGVLKKIQSEHRVHINYYHALLLFMKGEHKQSLKILNQLLNVENEYSLDHYFIAARVLQLLNYFEVKDLELLHHRAISVKRSLENKKQLGAFEKELLNFFIKADVSINRSGFQKLHSSLIKILKNNGDRSAIQELDVMEWVEGKLK